MAIVFRCDGCGRRYKVGDEKAGRRGRCRDCGAELNVPAPPETEVLPSGGKVYRHKPRERDFQLAAGDSENIEAISDYIERHVGKIETVFHELVSDLVHIDVHVIEPTDRRPFYTLVTSGMSDLPMTAPPEMEEFRYAELMICLPPDWPLSQEAFEDESNYWPVRLLKLLARLPHEYQTWLCIDHTVPNGDPPEPYAPNTKFVCAMLVPPVLEDEDFFALEIDEEKTIRFYSILPLYAEETDYKLKHGADALMERLDQAGISPVVDVGRKNVCRKRFGLF
jgi:hypothetical protein